MNSSTVYSFLIAAFAASLLSSCSSTTYIHSNPEGAKLYMNEQFMGFTPYTYSDTKIVGSSTTIRLEKEGYDPFRTQLVRSERADVGAIIGGLFVWVPFLWVMQYDPEHNYDLQTAGTAQRTQTTAPPAPPTDDKLERLRQLKKLYDDGTLTKEEFDREKQKILDQN